MVAMMSEASAPPAVNVDELVVAPAQQLWGQVLAYAPRVGSALLVLLVMWLVAKLVRAAVVKVLGMTKLDDATKSSWLGRIIGGLADGFTPAKAIGSLAYVAILLLALSTAADLMGLEAVTAALSTAIGFLPKLVSALLVLVVGGYIASAARKAIGAVLQEMKNPYTGVVEGLTEGTIVIIVVTVAVDVLGIDLSFITSNLALIIGTAVISVAFLLSWSMRKPAEEILANYYLRRMVAVGDQVKLGGAEGTVERFAALGLVLKDNTGTERFVPAREVLNGLERRPGAQSLRKR